MTTKNINRAGSFPLRYWEEDYFIVSYCLASCTMSASPLWYR